ncbi:hypothetical protein Golomagni_05595 [Golovinomyces magnicellulatus]|nr:hypothetical protein Golomagni_05595 [Golovinomyces magnicellulatus]
MFSDGSNAQSSTQPTTEPYAWNTKNLTARIGADLAASCSAAACVAPLVTVIDKAIMQNASGQATLFSSLATSCSTFLRRPHRIVFSRPFFLITLLYGGTYLAANTVDTLSAITTNQPASSITSGVSKFAASSTANICLCLFKDAKFAQFFGPSGPPRPFPSSSFALFIMRDYLTIFASFNVPPLLGPLISHQLDPKSQLLLDGQTVAQFAAPAFVQLLNTPLHLLGLDLYNRQGATIRWSQRWATVRKNWAISAAARMCRILPAFGIGGVLNAGVRKNLMESIE